MSNVSSCVLSLLVLCACSSSAAAPPRERDPDAEKEEVRQVVEAFFAAADNHHLSRLNSLLHPQFRLVVTRPDMELQTADRQEYMALMMSRIIGGMPRRIDDVATRVSGDRALSHVKLEGPHASFDAMQTFVREDGKWMLIHSLIQYDPKS